MWLWCKPPDAQVVPPHFHILTYDATTCKLGNISWTQQNHIDTLKTGSYHLDR